MTRVWSQRHSTNKVLYLTYYFNSFCIIGVYKKRLPEDDLNTSKPVGVLYDKSVLLVYCAFIGLNNKLYKMHGT